jgi:mutator protein MutT
MDREYPTRPIVAVAGVVFNTKDEVLLVRRGKEPGKGSWGIPGGAVELGERLKDAVKRELMEETGITVDPLELITIVDRVYPDDEGRVRFHYIIVEYLCQAADVKPKASDDVDRALWVSHEEAKEYPLPAITHEVIKTGRTMFKAKNQIPPHNADMGS